MPSLPASRAALPLGLAFLSLTIGATASTASGTRIGIGGQVPILCRAEIEQAGPSGRLNEFCNDAAGYDVWLDHGPLGGSASVSIDGNRLALSPGGSTLISSSDRAAIRSRNLVFRVPPGSRLIVRVVPR